MFQCFSSDIEKPIMFDRKDITGMQYRKQKSGLYKLDFCCGIHTLNGILDVRSWYTYLDWYFRCLVVVYIPQLVF